MKKEKKGEILQMKKYSPAKHVCFFFVLLGIGANGGKLFLAVVYNAALEKMNEADIKNFFLLGFTSALVIVAISIINWIQKIFSERQRQEIIAKGQGEMLRILGRKGLNKIEKISEGEWETLFSDDIEQCSDSFFKYRLPFSIGICFFVASIGLGLYLSKELTFVIILCSICALCIPKFFMDKIKKAYEGKIQNKEKLQEQFIQPLHFKNVIKAYSYEEKCVKNFQSAYENYACECVKEAKLSGAMRGISIGSAFTISSLWMVIGIFFMINRKVSVGDFAAFMMLSDYLNWPFTEMGSLLGERTKMKVSFQRIEKYLHVEEEEREVRETHEPNQISFLNPSFFYKNSGKMIIKEREIKLKKGDRIAIVGGSGKGKTTLCKLLTGGYLPSEGEIAISFDGKRYTGGMIGRIVGYQPQRNSIFSGTIEENIRIGKEGATKEEVRKVGRIACVDKFVKELPEGYETVIGNNAKFQLSGGQIARIALARTLIRSVPIYVLDEFTAALDKETESEILNHVKELDAVIICVTHRKETREACNRIININSFVAMEEVCT
ncbi:ABC transporter ATP-binding protein [bacterium 1XD42-8]|nr:ABC transporter ATP-binding protein [bacterium 1XD42-8]